MEFMFGCVLCIFLFGDHLAEEERVTCSMQFVVCVRVFCFLYVLLSFPRS